MKLICPSCGAVHSADAWQNDAIARQCLKLTGELQYDISSRCFAYIALFRPSTKSLAWKKVLRLLFELKDLSSAPHIAWNKGVARKNSAKAWGMAMEQMTEHPPKRLPLKTHGYLHAIAYENADEMDKRIEIKKNQAERSKTSVCRKSVNEEPQRLSMEMMKKIREENYRKRKK